MLRLILVVIIFRAANAYMVQSFGPSKGAGLGRWSAWSDCSRSCGYGTSVRTRQCLLIGYCRDSKMETKSCSTLQCKPDPPKPRATSVTENAVQIEWSPVREASIYVIRTLQQQDYSKNYISVRTDQTSLTTFLIKFLQPGTSYKFTVTAKTKWGTKSDESVAVTARTKVTDLAAGVPDPWAPWSDCSRSCSGGTRERTRNCKTRVCQDASREVENCNTFECPPARSRYKCISSDIWLTIQKGIYCLKWIGSSIAIRRWCGQQDVWVLKKMNAGSPSSKFYLQLKIYPRWYLSYRARGALTLQQNPHSRVYFDILLGDNNKYIFQISRYQYLGIRNNELTVVSQPELFQLKASPRRPVYFRSSCLGEETSLYTIKLKTDFIFWHYYWYYFDDPKSVIRVHYPNDTIDSRCWLSSLRDGIHRDFRPFLNQKCYLGVKKSEVSLCHSPDEVVGLHYGDDDTCASIHSITDPNDKRYVGMNQYGDLTSVDNDKYAAHWTIELEGICSCDGCQCVESC